MKCCLSHLETIPSSSARSNILSIWGKSCDHLKNFYNAISSFCSSPFVIVLCLTTSEWRIITFSSKGQSFLLPPLYHNFFPPYLCNTGIAPPWPSLHIISSVLSIDRNFLPSFKLECIGTGRNVPNHLPFQALQSIHIHHTFISMLFVWKNTNNKRNDIMSGTQYYSPIDFHISWIGLDFQQELLVTSDSRVITMCTNLGGKVPCHCWPFKV